MSQSIDKIAEKHTKNEMKKRDGETYIAVGLFLVALGIPVIIATYWAMERPNAAIVNVICGLALLGVGTGAIAYGWRLFRQATKKTS